MPLPKLNPDLSLDVPTRAADPATGLRADGVDTIRPGTDTYGKWLTQLPRTADRDKARDAHVSALA